jgi:hypothetical protein
MLKFCGLETPASFRNGRCFFRGQPLSPPCQYLGLNHIFPRVSFARSLYGTEGAPLRFLGSLEHRLGMGNLPALLGG